MNENSDLSCYITNVVNLERGASYMDSPDWIKKKEATKQQQILSEMLINAFNRMSQCY